MTDERKDHFDDIGRSPRPSGEEKAARPAAPLPQAGIASDQFNVLDPQAVATMLDWLKQHRKTGRGKLIGIAGLPGHGKSEFAKTLDAKWKERAYAEVLYEKTHGTAVNVFFAPDDEGKTHALIDVAGEGIATLIAGNPETVDELPALMRTFLWPVMPHLDGLIFAISLPNLWERFNTWKKLVNPSSHEEAFESTDVSSSQSKKVEMEANVRLADAERMRLIDSFRYLLKYARVARSGRLPGQLTPTRSRIDKEYKHCPMLDIPVAFAFTKADIYAPKIVRPEGLYSPPGKHPRPPVLPEEASPVKLAQEWFPELVDFLRGNVRFFRFGFVQSCIDPGVTGADGVLRISAEFREVDQELRRDATDLRGAEETVEFITGYDWSRFRWLSMGRVLTVAGVTNGLNGTPRAPAAPTEHEMDT